MPSPIAHVAVGYAIYRLYQPHAPKPLLQKIGFVPGLLLLTAGLSLLPDLDAIPGILFGHFGRFHNNISHSFIIGVLVAVGIGGAAAIRQRRNFWPWFLVTLLCYEFHVLMDLYTVGGRGVLAFWPLYPERLDPAPKLFFGLRWSEGLISAQHLWTLSSELIFALLVGLATQLIVKRKGAHQQPGSSQQMSQNI
ncbi:MAG: metal-dependent hydrolase [Anaerolineae bacterium]|nr:metal-dependent hydrolase [Anaerolineae bacterium]